MILDIITAALIVIPMGIGMAKGFAYIVVRLLGWVGAGIAGFFGAPKLREYLADGTLGTRVHTALEAQFADPAADVSESADGLPAILGNVVDQTVDNAVEMMVSALEYLILTLISFLLIVIAIRLLLTLVIRPISKRQGKSPLSIMNKTAGLVVGSIEGLLLAFLFLAALIPVMHMASAETAASIAEGLKYSYLAGTLYDGNLLVAIFGLGIG